MIRSGGLVAFPTETVYGLGACALDSQAVEAIYKAKGRPSDNPMIIHIAEVGMLPQLVRDGFVPPYATLLIRRFWPGPLTLVLPKDPKVPNVVTGGLSTVAVRMPANTVALELILKTGLPLAAPSANLSGRPSPTTAEDVLEDLDGRIPLILDAGPTGVGLESTVVDLTSDPPTILRPGGVTREELENCLGFPVSVASQPSAEDAPRSPGMKYRHYAPRAVLKIVDGPKGMIGKLRDLPTGTRVGWLVNASWRGSLEVDLPQEIVYVRESYYRSVQELAASLFREMRECDRLDVDVILVSAVPEIGLGVAVMNRLQKAMGGE